MTFGNKSRTGALGKSSKKYAADDDDRRKTFCQASEDGQSFLVREDFARASTHLAARFPGRFLRARFKALRARILILAQYSPFFCDKDIHEHLDELHWADKVPILNVMRDLFFDVPPTPDQLRDTLNIIGLTSALVLSFVAPLAFSYTHDDYTDAIDRLNNSTYRHSTKGLLAPGNHSQGMPVEIALQHTFFRIERAALAQLRPLGSSFLLSAPRFRDTGRPTNISRGFTTSPVNGFAFAERHFHRPREILGSII